MCVCVSERARDHVIEPVIQAAVADGPVVQLLFVIKWSSTCRHFIPSVLTANHTHTHRQTGLNTPHTVSNLLNVQTVHCVSDSESDRITHSNLTPEARRVYLPGVQQNKTPTRETQFLTLKDLLFFSVCIYTV